MNGLLYASLRRTFALALCALLATSCATVVSSEGMVPEDFAIEVNHESTVELETFGSSPPFPWAAPSISDETLHEALFQAIGDSSVFQSVGTDAHYRLAVAVEDLSGDEYSVIMSSDIVMSWVLTDLDSSRVVLNETIETHGEGNSLVADSFDDQYRDAIVKAVQKNIREGLERISRAEL